MIESFIKSSVEIKLCTSEVGWKRPNARSQNVNTAAALEVAVQVDYWAKLQTDKARPSRLHVK